MSQDVIIFRPRGRDSTEAPDRGRQAREQAAENRRILAEHGPLAFTRLADRPRRKTASRGRLARSLLAVGVVAPLLGLGAGWLFVGDRAGGEQARTPPTAPAGAALVPAPPEPRNATSEPVRQALERVRADYATGGAAAVARVSRSCLASVATGASDAQLDYCWAYDRFGRALIARSAPGFPVQTDAASRRIEVSGTPALRTAEPERGDVPTPTGAAPEAVAAAEPRPTPPIPMIQAPPLVLPPPSVRVAEADPAPPRERTASEPAVSAPNPPAPRPAPTTNPAPTVQASSEPPLAPVDWRLYTP